MFNTLGGVTVLATYAWGAVSAEAVMDSLWGGVPVAIRPVYTANMFLSALGYFLFAPYIAFRVDTRDTDLVGRFGYSVFSVLMLLVLIPSACWLPLVAVMVTEPSAWLWWIIRLDLFLVALGSSGLLVSLVILRPPTPPGRAAAIAGLVSFFFQTAILDALIWPAYFMH